MKTKTIAAPDAVPNRFLRAEDWSDPRYSTLRGDINEFYRTTLRGLPHPSHARHPETIVTHWSREWEYPWTVLNARLEPGMSVADLGCGGSPVLPYVIRELGCVGAGVDLTLVSPNRKHTLRGFSAHPSESYPEARWLERSMDDTGLESGTFDRALCISVLEHVTEELAASTLREMRRILKPDGLALITTDVDGAHRTLSVPFQRIIELAAEEGLVLHGSSDFDVPPSDDRPGTYDVVGLVFSIQN